MTLAVELLRVTNEAIGHCPFLLLQPLGTCAVLLLLWALWAAVLLSLGTAGEVGAAALLVGRCVGTAPGSQSAG